MTDLVFLVFAVDQEKLYNAGDEVRVSSLLHVEERERRVHIV